VESDHDEAESGNGPRYLFSSELYVNDWTVDLGEVGRKALAMLSKRAKDAGIVDASTPEISVLSFPKRAG